MSKKKITSTPLAEKDELVLLTVDVNDLEYVVLVVMVANVRLTSN